MGAPKITNTTPEYVKYATNIDMFVSNLPKSQFRVLYFIKDKGQYVPRLNTVAGKWINNNTPNEPLYVVKGLESGFCYIYKESQIKYKDFPGGGQVTTVSNTNWGDHLTVGVQTSFTNRNMLIFCTHITNYIEDVNHMVGTYIPSRLGCVTNVTDTIDSTTQCLHNSIPDGSTMDKYRLVTNEETTLQIIKQMHDVMMGKYYGGKKEKKTYITYNDKKYVLNKGQKGGTYITINNRKKYISSTKRGGSDKFINGSGTFSDAFIEFVNVYVINGIHDDNLTDILIWFDGGNTLMVRYTFDIETDGIDNTKSTVFGINKQHLTNIFDIFLLPEHERTMEQQNDINMFTESFIMPTYIY